MQPLALEIGPGYDSVVHTERKPLLLACLAVFLVALGLRFGHLLSLMRAWEGTHLFSTVYGDATHHWNEALEILDRDFWLRDELPWKGPGYSYFLAGLVALFGRSPGALRWPLALLGSLNCAGLVLVAARTLPVRWACLAGMLAAVNGVLIAFDGEWLLPTPLITLSLLALWLLSRPGAGRWAHAGAGGLSGLAVLFHPAYLLPTVGLGALALRRRAAFGIAFLAAAALSIAPLSLMNTFVRGERVLISWNGGINAYVGNQPAFDQYSGNRTNAWSRILQSPVDAGMPGKAERDRLYYRLALRQALSDPLPALAILGQKTWILLSPVEYASNISFYELREHSVVLQATMGRLWRLWLPFGLWGPLAILGFVATWRSRNALDTALATWSLGVALSIVLVFCTSRYRAPIVFLGNIWVAGGIAAAWDAWLRRDLRRLGSGLAAFVLLVVILGWTAVPQRGYPLPLEWNESFLLSMRGSSERAESWVQRALARFPDDAPLRLAVSGFYERRRDRERQREQLRIMLALPDLEPDLVSGGHEALAASYHADRRFDEARQEIEAAIAVGIDETEWRSVPYYQLGLGPVTACWLRLQAATIEFDAGDPERARELMAHVRRECQETGRLAEKLAVLDARSVTVAPWLGGGQR